MGARNVMKPVVHYATLHRKNMDHAALILQNVQWLGLAGQKQLNENERNNQAQEFSTKG